MTTKERPKKEKKKSGPKRQERRFVPRSSTNPAIVRGLGAIAALVLGAGLYAYFYGKTFADDEKLKSVPAYLIAGGSMLMGLVIWLGSSGEPAVRVGDPGIALEKGEVRRMPWWAVDSITWQGGALALVVVGKDESGKDWTLRLPLSAYGEAIGWIVKQANERIPKKVDISDKVLEKMPAASEHAGMKLDLEPLQVVGRKCAVTGKTISYEPDARVCPRCERIYLKRAVPKKCKCGASLLHLRPKIVDEEAVDEDEEDESKDEREVDRDETPDSEGQVAAAETEAEDDERRTEKAEGGA